MNYNDFKDIAQRIKEQVNAEDAIIRQLWKIAHVLVGVNVHAYNHSKDEVYCVFCQHSHAGMAFMPNADAHEPNCIVKQAQRLIADTQAQSFIDDLGKEIRLEDHISSSIQEISEEQIDLIFKDLDTESVGTHDRFN